MREGWRRLHRIGLRRWLTLERDTLLQIAAASMHPTSGEAYVLGLLVGFMLGVVIRNSAGAIVAYFLYSFVMPTLTDLLAGSQQWFRDVQPWVDPNVIQHTMWHGSLTGEQWWQLAVTSTIWLVIPMTVRVRFVLEAEVK